MTNTSTVLAEFASQTLVLLRGWGSAPVKAAERYLEAGFTVVLTGPPCEVLEAEIPLSQGIQASGDRFIWDPIPDYRPTESGRTHPRWSAGLNLGLRHAARLAKTYFMPVSNEVAATDEQLAQLFGVLAQNPTLGCVGTTFRGHTQDGQPVSLGRSYDKLRNTLAIWKLAVFTSDPRMSPGGSIEEVGFREVCDGYGGMEDYDRVIQLLRSGLFGVVVLPLGISLTVGVNYDQATKEATERKAMSRIDEDYDTKTPVHRLYAEAS